MRTIALISLLVGSSIAGDIRLTPGGGNYVRVQNGKIVEYDFANSLEMPQMRSDDGAGSTDDNNVFNGQISISDALDPDSPFSQWVDDLLNPESDPYKQAVIDALKILLAILLAALAPLGINNFTVLILGFAPGSVQINYQFTVDPDEHANAGSPNSDDLGQAVYDAIDNSNDGADLLDADGNPLGITLDNTATTVNGGDGTEIVSECPSCWRIENGACVPDPQYVDLTCNSDGMIMDISACVMGETELASLSLSGGCDSVSGEITESGAGTNDHKYHTNTALDGCSTVMNFDDDKVKFTNVLSGSFGGIPGEIISTADRFSVEFVCEYSTTYDDISKSTEVTASVNSGPTDGIGELSFTLDTYTDASFQTLETSQTVRVGSTLFFGVSISNPISGLEFTVTDCTVYSNEDHTADDLLEYGILVGSCPNNRVNFVKYLATHHTLTRFGYTVFEFKNSDATTLHLSCNIVVCDDEDASSTCKHEPSCDGRRKRRSLEAGVNYYRVSKNFIAA